MGRRRRRLRNLSPQDTYYDPRYNRHFYSGILPPLPPQVDPTLQLQPGPPATPTVDVYPMKRTRRPSILITGGSDRSRRESRLERRVSWDSPEEEGAEEGDENPRDDGNASRKRRWLALAVCTAIVLVFLAFAGMQLAAGYRAQGPLRAGLPQVETTVPTAAAQLATTVRTATNYTTPVEEWNATTTEGIKEATEITTSDDNSETLTSAEDHREAVVDENGSTDDTAEDSSREYYV
ncbi:uncharacterized protein LOC144180046 [Haemaphysalis longicornis]